MVWYMVKCVSKGEPACPAEFAWLRLFGVADLREFLDELSRAINAAVRRLQPWDGVEAIIEEWRRSANALDDGELRVRFRKSRASHLRIQKPAAAQPRLTARKTRYR